MFHLCALETRKNLWHLSSTNEGKNECSGRDIFRAVFSTLDSLVLQVLFIISTIVIQAKAGRSFFDLLDDESNAAKNEDVVGNLEKLLNHSLGKLNNHKVLGGPIIIQIKNSVPVSHFKHALPSIGKS